MMGVMENNIIKEIIKTLSQFGQVNYRIITDGVEFYRAGKLYNADYLTEVSLKDKNNLQLILGIAYLIAGVS